jgi:Spy/CpxP family protein refolding chaperone
MKTKFWMVAAALMALVLGSFAMLSYAQDNATASPQNTWRGHRGHMGRLARELNLTDAQKTQIKDIFKANKQSGMPLSQQIEANRKAMLEATANGNYDQAKIEVLATQQSQLMSQLIVQKQAIQHQIYTQVLTPDQRAKADQMRAQQISRLTSRMEKMSQAGAANSSQQ